MAVPSARRTPATPAGSAGFVRLGFAEPAAAERLLRAAGLAGDRPLVGELAGAADPDLAVRSLSRLLDATADRTDLLAALHTAEGFRRRLCAVLGASSALGDHLARHPADWRALLPDETFASRPTRYGLTARLLATVGAESPQGAAAGADPEVLDALRRGHRTLLLTLAARDLTEDLAVDDVAAELSDLADATLAAGLCTARAALPAGAEPARLAVIAMGKCGGRELNYVSDVDVVFVAEPAETAGDGAAEQAALHTATALATALIRACGETTSEGAIWPVDVGLRPEGRAGPLVRTLASHAAYYQRWAKTWEFQALLKARPAAGDAALGAAYLETVRPMVWTAAPRPQLVAEVQAMRRRVEEQLPPQLADRELKLGPGGLRDVEFAVQLLQLVHGRADPALREPATLPALGALAAGGYVGREDARELAAAYRFLRRAEHRLQLRRLRRAHTLPTDAAELRSLARSLGYRGDPAARFAADRAAHAREVRRLHEKVFYRPLLGAVARLPAADARLGPEAARARLSALGFADPDGALRHLAALTGGVSRRAAIQRTLLPAMLGWFAEAADPDAGLLAFRQVSEALGSSPWYLRLLRDEGVAAERLAHLLAASRYVADLLGRAPEAVAMLAAEAELRPRQAAALAEEFSAAVGRAASAEAGVAAARGLRRRELLRTAGADLSGLLDVEQVGAALADVATATVTAGLAAATGAAERRLAGPLPVRLAVIGMGRLGGAEQGYGSDADVLFLYAPVRGSDSPDLTRLAHDVVAEARRLLAMPGPDAPLVIDPGLRPEGRQGPLVRSLSAYAEYYRRWRAPWEVQALLRARPVAGDADLGRAFLELADGHRYPSGGLGAAAERELRRVKARVEAERLPRGADPALHLKLGRGGLADVEWTVQLLQLRHGCRLAGLRTPATLPALRAAAEAGLIDRGDAETVATAWRLASRIRNAVMLVRGRPGETLPTDLRMLSGVARVLGYPPDGGPRLVEDYRRATRRARSVVERIFYES
jgi:glutamate-ammonia-ligase adenylyltransferase